jgi:hypothetical protein
VTFSATDVDWEFQINATFGKRMEFELLQINKLRISETEIFRKLSQLCIRYDYSPRMTSATSIKFRPNELPKEISLWDIPRPTSRRPHV